MNFFDYFTQGLRNTIKFKNRANFSFRGETVPVYVNTILDTWYMGDFTTAEYDVSVEYGPDDIEKLTVIVTAKVNQASLTVYGRTNNGRDLVQFSTTVNNSSVSLLASPLYATDNITPLTGVYLTWKATYSERLTQLQQPKIVGESTNLGGEPGILSNWNNSNLSNGFMQVNDNGSITLSSISNIAVTGQTSLTSSFILDSLTFNNTDGTLSITTAPINNTITFSLSKLPQLTVTGAIISTISAGTSDNVTIGSTRSSSVAFSTLSTTTQANLLSNSATVTIAPQTTILTIAPVTNSGSMDNIKVGSLVARTGKFSKLTISQSPTLNTQLVSIASIQGRLLMGAI